MSTPKNTPWWPLLPYRGHFPAMTMNNFFSKEDVGTLEKMISTSYDLEEAVTGYRPGAPDDSARHSQVAYLGVSEISAWLYQKITPAVMEANYKCFQMNLRTIETMMYSEYNCGENGEPGDFFAKHTDNNIVTPIGTDRKLTFIVQLDDPSSYAGGEIILQTASGEMKLSKNQGDIIFFPSSTVHEVTPVTSGKRRSLVGWVHGPN